jgi:hypothetical protein
MPGGRSRETRASFRAAFAEGALELARRSVVMSSTWCLVECEM